MVLRKIVAVVGAVVVLVGLAEIVLPHQMINLTDAMMHPVTIRILSVVELVLGAVLIAAALRRTVGLRTYVLILGIWLIIVGFVMFAAPLFVIDLVYALLLNRVHGAQLVILWASGLVRIVLGAALLWAGIKPPRPVVRARVEHR